MDLQTTIIGDVAEYIVTRDGVATGCVFTLGERFLVECKHLLTVDVLDEIGICCRGTVALGGAAAGTAHDDVD